MINKTYKSVSFFVLFVVYDQSMCLGSCKVFVTAPEGAHDAVMVLPDWFGVESLT